MSELQNRKSEWQKPIFLILFFFCIILVGALFRIMEDVLKPVVVSVMLSFVFFPIIKKLSTKLKFPWWLGITVVFITFFGIFFGIGNILITSFKSILAVAPDYADKFSTITKSISQTIAAHKDSVIFSLFNFNQEQSFFENIANSVDLLGPLKNFAVGFTGIVFSTSKMLFLVILFSIFLLIEMKFFSKKITKAFNGEDSEKITKIIKNAIAEITHYISIKFLMSFITGVFVTIVCAAFKMDFAIVWGFLSFIMNFIPTFGSLIAWAVTTLFALIQFYPSPVPVILISALLIFENVMIGNVIEPRILGKDLNISPFVILVSLSLWGWLWGFLGMVLAVPFTVTIKIFCENIVFLHPIAIFLGGSPQLEKKSNVL